MVIHCNFGSKLVWRAIYHSSDCNTEPKNSKHIDPWITGEFPRLLSHGRPCKDTHITLYKFKQLPGNHPLWRGSWDTSPIHKLPLSSYTIFKLHPEFPLLLCLAHSIATIRSFFLLLLDPLGPTSSSPSGLYFPLLPPSKLYPAIILTRKKNMTNWWEGSHHNELLKRRTGLYVLRVLRTVL